MKELITLIVAIIGIFTLIGSITFYLSLTSNIARMMQGDSNATQEFTESVKDEAIDEIRWTVIRALIITVAGALGLTGLVAIFRKL